MSNITIGYNGTVKLAKTSNSDRVLLNISGELFETRVATLQRFPQTLLGDRNKRLLYYCSASKQYFFHRTRIFFDAILFYYQSNGILLCPYEGLIDLFEEECRFFQLPEQAITNIRSKLCTLEFPKNTTSFACVETAGIKLKLWNILQRPDSSKTAKYYAVLSMTMIFISVAISCLKTIDIFKSKSQIYHKNPWAMIELTLNIWFLIEIISRIISTPNIKAFLKSSMNWIDIFSVAPYFLIIIISTDETFSIAFLRMMRFIRIMRLVHLSKHSKRLKLFCEIILSSMGDFRRLLVCLGMLVVLGGSIMYHIESRNSLSQFTSIPEGVYWGIQTTTTIGYGDISPVTIGGKLFASCFMVFGVLTLCMPVLFIVDKFQCMYEYNVT